MGFLGFFEVKGELRKMKRDWWIFFFAMKGGVGEGGLDTNLLVEKKKDIFRSSASAVKKKFQLLI